MIEEILAIALVLVITCLLFLIRYLILNVGKKKNEYKHIYVRRVDLGGLDPGDGENRNRPPVVILTISKTNSVTAGGRRKSHTRARSTGLQKAGRLTVTSLTPGTSNEKR